MTPTIVNRGVLIMTMLVAVIGMIDATIGHAYDLVAVFAIIGVLQLGLLVRMQGRRPQIPIRADLVRWFTERAALEGDTPESQIDRALAAFRDDLVGAGMESVGREDRS